MVSKSLLSVRQVLFVIVLALVIPAFVVAALFATRSYQERLSNTKSITLQTARALASTVDGELGSLLHTVRTMASSPDLEPGRLAAFYLHATQVVPEVGALNFVLTDPSGQQVLNTLRPLGANLPMHGNVPAFERMIATGQPVISDLFIGAVTKTPVLTVGVPIQRAGKVLYTLDVGYLPDRFQQLLAGRHFPSDWIVAIIDGSGTVVARTHAPEKFVGGKASPGLLRQMQRAPEGTELIETLEGLPVYAIYHRSPDSHWSVAIGVPQESMLAPLRRSLLLNLTATAALLGIGVVVATLASRRIALSLGRLAPLAESLARDEPLTMPRLTIREAACAAESLRKASLELQQSRAARDRSAEELREINLTLEQRVDERTAALHRSRQLLDAIVENLPATVVVKRAADLSFEYFNRAAETFLNAPRQSYYGKTDHDLFPPDLAAELEAQDRRVLAKGVVEANVERELPTPHGELRVLRVTKVPMLDEAGQPTRLMAIGLDVTDAKRAEDQLRVVATAFDAQEAMMITDSKRRILRVNRAFTEVTGYAADEVVGREPNLLGSGRHDGGFFADIWRTISSAGSWQGELWNRRKNGEEYPCWTTITAIQNDSGKVTNYVGVHTDISAQKRVEDEIRQLAFYDSLTGLPNRRLLMDRLHQAVAQSSRSGRKGALMFIDLDNFKTLNDTLGHDKGDELLRQVAKRLPLCVREGDTVARLGGDEFVVMLEDLDLDFERSAVLAEAVGQKVLERLNLPYTLGGHQYRSTPSVGVALFGNHHSDIDELLKRADLAMYEAKGAGRNAIRFFEPRMQTLVAAHAALEHELRLAVLQQDFVLHYQPQVNLKGEVVGAEALLRWNQGGQGLVLPEQFISLAEETGLILPIGRWAMHAACSQLVQWSRQPHMAHLHLSVNVSARQIQQPEFVEEVMRVIAATGAPAQLLTLELTESSLLHGFTEIAEKITAFKERGIAVALDDFGVGYSSLTYLRRLPIDELKIDRSFVHNVATDPNDAAIVRTIIALTKALELKVIAEGVEDTDQRDFLAYHGCTLFQGFYFGSPISAEELSDRLRPAPQPEPAPV